MLVLERWEHSTPVPRRFPFASCYAHILPSAITFRLLLRKQERERSSGLPYLPLYLGHGFQNAWLAPRGKWQSQKDSARAPLLSVFPWTLWPSLCSGSKFWLSVLRLLLKPQPFTAVGAPTDLVVGIMRLSCTRAVYRRARGPPGVLWSWGTVCVSSAQARFRCPIGLEHKINNKTIKNFKTAIAEY